MKKAAGGRYLAFELDGSDYAVEVERVEVVLETMPITRVPKAPRHLKGVINYRGSVIPVADLRSRFSLALGGPERENDGEVRPAAPETTALVAAEDRTLPVPLGQNADGILSSGASIVVLHVRYGGDDIVMGIMADAVREVMDIDASHIAEAPSLGGQGRGDLVAGIGQKDGRFIVLLDIEEAFALEDGYQAAEAR